MTDSVSRSALNQGILAAKSGGRLVARLHLRTAIESSGQDPIAWAWMAWLAETPEEAVASMQRAVALDPDDDVAWAGLRFVLSLASSSRFGATKSTTAMAPIEAPEAALPPTPVESVSFAPAAPASAEVDSTASDFTLAAPVPAEDSSASDIDLQPAPLRPTALEETLASSVEDEVPVASTEVEAQSEIPGELDIAALTIAVPSANHDFKPSVDASPETVPAANSEGDDWTSAFESTAPVALATATVEEETPSSPSWPPQTLASLPVEPPAPALVPVPAKAVAAPPVFEAAQPRSLPRKPKVLVVDDSPTVCKLVTITLSNRGYHVMSSPDGAEAISELAQSKPDLILMDITMPKLDGYKLCKLVTSHPSTKHIPVVMLSGKDGFFDKTRGKFAGCVDYITKPFDPENLLRVVNEYLPQPESARGASVAGSMRIHAGGG